MKTFKTYFPCSFSLLLVTFLLLIPFAGNAFDAKPQDNCDFIFSTNSNSISIADFEPANAIVKLFNPDWTTHFSCTGDCADAATIDGLTEGDTYYLSIKVYDNNWQLICEQTEYLTPTDSGNDPCNVSTSHSTNSITISGLSATHVIFKLFDQGWSTHASCFDNCNETMTFDNLIPGQFYHASYKMYDANWQPICEDLIDIQLDDDLTTTVDLIPTNFTGPSSGTANETVPYTVKIKNIGVEHIAEQFRVEGYISEDQQFSPDDHYGSSIFINTLPAGGSYPISHSLSIPDLPEGDYYWILVVDSEDNVMEFSESNNIISIPFHINEDDTPEDCGFLNSYPNLSFKDFGIETKIIEYPIRYLIKTPVTPNTPGTYKHRSMQIYKSGNLLSGTGFGSELITDRQGDISVSITEDKEVLFQLHYFTGSLKWEKIIPVEAPNAQLLDIVLPKVVQVYNGFLVTATVISGTVNNPIYDLLSIHTDPDGEDQQQHFLATNSIGDFDVFYPLNSTQMRYAIVKMELGEQRLVRFNTTGEIEYNVLVAGDQANDTVANLKFSASHVYALVQEADKAHIVKLNKSTGERIADFYPADILSPGSGASQENHFLGLLEMEDGGIVTGYTYTNLASGEKGYEYGKIDANENALWWHQLEEGYEFIPNTRTQDGGVLFIGLDPDGEVSLMKITKDGELLPDCSGPRNPVEIACDLEYTLVNKTLNVSGEGLNAPHVIIKVFDLNWQTIFSCTDDCGSSIDLSGEFAYRISVTLYDDNWQKTCTEVTILNETEDNLAGQSEEVLFFKATKNGSSNLLNWVVNNNYATEHFIVERALDEDHFEIISEQPPSDDGNQFRDYQFVDYMPAAGLNKYRLRQVLVDGSIRYSTIESIWMEERSRGISVFPNPATTHVQLNLSSFIGLDVEILLCNNLGQVLQQVSIDKLEEPILRMDTRDLKGGIYHLKVKAKGHKAIGEKLIINRI